MPGIPLDGDRAAKDSANYPSLHKTDDGIIHLPLGEFAGQIAVYNGSVWVVLPVTPQDPVSFADGSLADATDKINIILSILIDLNLIELSGSI